MNLGSLVKMKPMKGFSWWSGRTFVVLRFDSRHSGWVYLLTDEGKEIQVTTDILEVLS